MKKNNKHDKKRLKIKMNNAKSTKQKTVKFWNKQLSTAQQIALTIISIPIVIGFCFLILLSIGKYQLVNQGYNDIDTLIRSYFSAIIDGKPSYIKKCFPRQSEFYKDSVKTHSDLIESFENTTIDFDELNMVIEDCDISLSEIESQVKMNPVSDAKVCYIGAKMTKSANNGSICEYMAYYYATCYKCVDKWFLWSIDESYTEIISAVDSKGHDLNINNIKLLDVNLTTIGNQFTGYLYVPDTWRLESTPASESYKSGITCRSENNDAYISIYAMYKSSDLETFATNIVNTMSRDKNIADSIVLSEIQMDNNAAMCLTCTDPISKSDYMAIMFELPSDEYIHYITVETSTAAISMNDIAAYVSTFYME